MKLVGISGLAGSGKSEASRGLVARTGFVEVGLADELKRICMGLFPGWTEETLWGSSELRNAPDFRYGGLTPRKALQTLGVEFGRACYPNVWVDIVVRVAKAMLEDGAVYHRAVGVAYRWRESGDVATDVTCPGVVVPDLRFRNELEAIQCAGGVTIRIVRPGAGLDGEAGQHASEVEQLGIRDEEFDAVVLNTGSVADLHDRVNEAVISAWGGEA